MPVEFLTDDEAAAYGRYAGPPPQADLERVFFLDDEDRKLVDLRRGGHMKAGFALQLVTVRSAGLRGRATRHSQPGGREAVHRAGEDEVGPPAGDPAEVRAAGLRRCRGGTGRVGGCPRVDVRGRPESDLPRCDDLAAGPEAAAAGRDDAGAAGRAGAR